MLNAKNNNGLIILTLFLCTLFVYNDFGIRMIIGFALFFIGVLYAIISSGVLRVTRITAHSYLIIMVAVLLSYLRPTARLDKETIMYAIAMIMCFIVVCCANPDSKQADRAERVILVFALLCAILVILSRMARDFYLSTYYRLLSSEAKQEVYYSIWHGYSCTIGGDDTFHNYLFMLATFFSLGHIAETKKGWLKYYVRALFFVAASFLTGRRGEFLVLLFICVVVGLNILPRKQRKRLVISSIVLILIAIPFIPTLFGSLVFSRFSITMSQLQSGGDALGGRLELWSLAVNAFLNHPIIGMGWGSFSSLISDEFRALHGNVGNINNAHNIYLQFLAETGMVGFLLILLGLITLLIRTIKQKQKLGNISEDNSTLKKYNSVSLGIQVYFLLIGMIDPCFMKYYYWCYLGIAIILYQFVDNQTKNMPFFLQ